AQRLSAMLELQVALTAEREPQAMLDLLCRGAQEFMDCRCAAVAIFDAGGERFERCSSRGFGEDFDAQLLASDPKGGAMRRVVTSTEALRADNARDAQGLALPEFFPKVGNLLAVPIPATPVAPVAGWLCFADARSEGGFEPEHERFAVMIASQFAA